MASRFTLPQYKQSKISDSLEVPMVISEVAVARKLDNRLVRGCLSLSTNYVLMADAAGWPSTFSALELGVFTTTRKIWGATSVAAATRPDAK
ncbi:hypothetical protein EGR_04675 [Echinococcus granulosus]|uniref:Uncharacterized protein n=1 Tax=Echinococcus granulosus TaxID=6210 RepID=W6UHE5_ECHGR|nr:hypothetical protein EGR_04675 [Echinococcus granulosus]EUB60481.1 hypothetical protein EGR_04675 [Echinococcus granulosus]